MCDGELDCADGKDEPPNCPPTSGYVASNRDKCSLRFTYCSELCRSEAKTKILQNDSKRLGSVTHTKTLLSVFITDAVRIYMSEKNVLSNKDLLCRGTGGGRKKRAVKGPKVEEPQMEASEVEGPEPGRTKTGEE